MRCVPGDGCRCAARGQGRRGVRFLTGRGGRRPIRRRGCGGSARLCRWSGAGRAGALGGDAQGGAGGGPVAGAVAGAVVAEDAFDGDPGGGIPGVRAGQERRGRVLGLIRQDLGVSEAGVVIQGGVQVAVAQDRVAVAGALRAGMGLAVTPALDVAQDTPATAVGDVTELLDVHVDQLAGPGALIAADRHPGGPVQACQPRAAVTAQHRVHRRGRHAQPEADPGGAQPGGDPQAYDPPLGPPGCTGRAGVRPRRPVGHARGAGLPVPGGPPGRGGG